MPAIGYPDVHDEHRPPPSPLAQRLAAELLGGGLKPADLGLAEIELRFHGRGRVVEWVSAYGEFCPLVVQRMTDHYIAREAPHCPHLSGLSENSMVLHGVGGTYAVGAVESGSPQDRFADLDTEPDLVIRAALALDHLDTVRAAARASAQLHRLGHTPDPPELSL
jgi:hypothetical protein